MLGRITTFAAALAVSTAALAGEPPAPRILEPSTQWQVNYAADSCRLARSFGEGADQTIFYIEQYGPSAGFFLVVAGQSMKGFDDQTTKLGFGPGGYVSERPVQLGDLGNYKPALMTGMSLLELPEGASDEKLNSRISSVTYDPTPEQEAAITWFEVRKGRREPVRLNLGSMHKPMAAMRSCVEELMTHWGIDVAAHRTLSRPVEPKGNPGSWIGAGDYPRDLLWKGAQGIVRFRLTIDEQGKPRECHIQQTTRPKAFEDLVCNLIMRRATFQPALDANGKPIASFFQTAVRFEVPR